MSDQEKTTAPSLTVLRDQWREEAANVRTNRMPYAIALRRCADALIPHLHREAETQQELAELRDRYRVLIEGRDELTQQLYAQRSAQNEQLAEQQAEVERLKAAVCAQAELVAEYDLLRARAHAAVDDLGRMSHEVRRLTEDNEALAQQLREQQADVATELVPSAFVSGANRHDVKKDA